MHYIYRNSRKVTSPSSIITNMYACHHNVHKAIEDFYAKLNKKKERNGDILLVRKFFLDTNIISVTYEEAMQSVVPFNLRGVGDYQFTVSKQSPWYNRRLCRFLHVFLEADP